MFRLVQRVSGNPAFLSDTNAFQLGWRFASAHAPEDLSAPFLEEGRTDFDNLEAIVLAWVLRVRAAREAAVNGVPISFLHYGDLTGKRRETTAKLLAACGLDPAHLEQGMKGFERDAHEGSATSNAVSTVDLEARHAARIGALLERWGQDDLLHSRL